MNTKITLLCLFAWICAVPILGQSEQDYGLIYARSSVSYIVINNNISQQHKQLLDAHWPTLITQTRDRFDLNPIPTVSLQPPASLSSSILSELQAQRVPNQLMAFWWNRKPDGSFDIERVGDRGVYNATDRELMQYEGDIRGMAKVRDQGQALIGKSLIIVLEFQSVQTYEEYYNRRDSIGRATATRNNTQFTPVERVYRGYMADVTARRYRLQFSPEIQDHFYGQLWLDGTEPATEIEARKAKFESFDFPIVLDGTETFKAQGRARLDGQQGTGQLIQMIDQMRVGSAPVTMEGFFLKMVEDAKTKIDEKLESEISVRASLFATKPLQAKIGTKEGLRIDSRYFVYEYVQNKQGETLMRRTGVIRAKEVSNNKKVATGNTTPSTFYQITGKKLDPGMLLEEKNEIGLFVGVLYGESEAGGLSLTADYMASKITHVGHFTGFFVTGTATFSNRMYYGQDYSFLRLGLGLRKDHYLVKFVRVGIGLEGGFESATYSGNEEAYANTWYGTPTLEVGLHLRHDVQLIARANYFVWLGAPTDTEGNEFSATWSELFPGRGLSNTFSPQFGFRVNL